MHSMEIGARLERVEQADDTRIMQLCQYIPLRLHMIYLHAA